MIDPDGDAPERDRALAAETQAMLRGLLLCELVEHIDAAASGSTGRPLPALDAMVEVRFALDRIDEGTYGRCETCTRLIPLDELRARPEVRHCRSCGPKTCPPRRFVRRRSPRPPAVRSRPWSAP